MQVELYVFLSAICAAFAFGTVMYRYSLYKICLGPEEDLDEELKANGALGGMSRCIMNGDRGRWLFVLGTALLWLALGWKWGFGWLYLVYGLTALILLGLSIVDAAIFELPPEMNAAIAFLGAIRLIMDLAHWYEYLIGALVVSGMFLLMALASRGKAMGGGDIKLMAALGLLLGWKKILLVLILGAFLGGIIHGTRMLLTKEKHVLSFGPYLAAAAVLAMMWGDEMISFYINTFLPELS